MSENETCLTDDLLSFSTSVVASLESEGRHASQEADSQPSSGSESMEVSRQESEKESRKESEASVNPLIVDRVTRSEVEDSEDDDYDKMREAEEKKIQRYAFMTAEEAEAMDREYSTYSRIPDENLNLTYRQRMWFKAFEKELKQAKRKPRKPTSFCKYFLEVWSQLGQNSNKLRFSNPDYVDEREKKRKEFRNESNDKDDHFENLGEKKKIKLEKGQENELDENWKFPTFFEFKKQVDDVCEKILL